MFRQLELSSKRIKQRNLLSAVHSYIRVAKKLFLYTSRNSVNNFVGASISADGHLGLEIKLFDKEVVVSGKGQHSASGEKEASLTGASAERESIMLCKRSYTKYSAVYERRQMGFMFFHTRIILS
jgi:hypothetical protein